MKLKITLAFMFFAFVFSCKKDATNNPLTGKWRTTDIFYTSNMSEPLYIQFIWPGKVKSTYFSKCTSYSAEGNNLTLINTGTPITKLTFTYTISQDSLTLYPSDNFNNSNLTFVKE